MGRRKGGVLEPQLSICLRTRCSASLMTIAVYGRFRCLIVGNTTCRTVDTGSHKPRHASNTRAVQVPQNYPTRFPDCVGLVPNSTATTLRTVKALDTDSSSRRTGHNGLGTDSAGITILISLFIIPQFKASALICFVTCQIFASSLQASVSFQDLKAIN